MEIVGSSLTQGKAEKCEHSGALEYSIGKGDVEIV